MKYKSLSFVLALFVSVSALAHKNGGGGNGVGGVLLDQAVYAKADELKPIDLTILLDREQKVLFTRYPLLRYLSHDVILTGKTWYLDDRKFQPMCRNQMTVQAHQDIWACQNDVEVRINRKWWKSATPHVRSELLIHEVFTALWIADDNAKSIGAVVAAYLDPKSSPTEVQLKSAIAGLPIFETSEVYDRAILLLKKFQLSTCAVTDRDQALAIADSIVRQSTADESKLADTADAARLFAPAIAYMSKREMYGPGFCDEAHLKNADSDLGWALWQGFKSLYPTFFM